MPTYLTNLAFPNRRADLSGGQGTQYVIGYEANGGPNQQVWSAIIEFTTAAYPVDK